MPKLTLPYLLLVIISTAAAAASDISPAPYPAGDDEEQFLKTCVEKFTDKCGSQVFRSVFLHTVVTEPCCKNLEGVGKPCHDGLIRRIHEAGVQRERQGSNGSSGVVVNEEMVSGILPQGEKVWNDCVRLGRVLPPRVRWFP